MLRILLHHRAQRISHRCRVDGAVQRKRLAKLIRNMRHGLVLKRVKGAAQVIKMPIERASMHPRRACDFSHQDLVERLLPVQRPEGMKDCLPRP